MKKTASTHSQNEIRLVVDCPLTYTFTLLGKRWKPIILWKLHEGQTSSAQLLRAIPLISRKMLFQDLAELVADGLVEKTESLRPVYSLTALAETLLPLLAEMNAWGLQHRPVSPAKTESRPRETALAGRK
jgi:DNA-binding HxlR family transcriptional regulator